MSQTLDQKFLMAATHVEKFNRQHGAQLIRLAERPLELVTADELIELARQQPGPYLASNAYRAIKGRKPTHGETVKLGQLLGFMTVARRKHGPQTMWLLDKAFAERAH